MLGVVFRFKSGYTNLEDNSGRGRLSDFDDQALLAAVEQDDRSKTRMLTEKFNVDHSTIVKAWIASNDRHFFALGIDQLSSKWEAVTQVDGEYAPE